MEIICFFLKAKLFLFILETPNKGNAQYWIANRQNDEDGIFDVRFQLQKKIEQFLRALPLINAGNKSILRLEMDYDR